MTTGSLDQVKELRERTGAGMMDCKAALKEASGDLEKAVDILRKKGMAQAAKRAGREAKEGLILTRIDGSQAVIVEVNCETDFVSRTDDFRKFGELVLNEVASQGDAAVGSDKINQTIAELSGKIGEKLVARRGRRLKSAGGAFFTYIHSNNKLGVLVELSAKPENAKNAALQELGKNLAMQIAAGNPLCLSRAEVPAATLEREKAIYKEEIKGKPDNVVDKIIQGKLEKFYQTNCLLEQAFIKDDKISVTKLLEQASKSLGDAVKVNQFVRFQLGENIAS